jgi:A/G-specific adenine glycosylase
MTEFSQFHFSQKLTQWYEIHKRDLPWRNTTNPYYIWLSEIILQQTRVVQGMPYYYKFVEAFPTVFDLAAADEAEVLRLWQGLGYYSRARNLHKTAKMVVDEYNGVFPDSYQELLKLKGVGSYTAAAIASFSYNEPVAVLDGNVYRVLSRVFGIETDIASNEAKKSIQNMHRRFYRPIMPIHTIKLSWSLAQCNVRLALHQIVCFVFLPMNASLMHKDDKLYYLLRVKRLR